MESWNEVLILEEGEYLKVNVSLYKCSATHIELSHISDHSFPDQDTSWTQTSTSKPPLLKNVLGENLFSSLQGLFVPAEKEVIASNADQDEESMCHVIKSFEIPVFTVNSFWIFIWLLSAVIMVCAIILMKRCIHLTWYTRKSKTEKCEKTVRTKDDKLKFEPGTDNKEVVDEIGQFRKQKEKSDSDTNGIHLSYQCCILKSSAIGNSSVITFLDHTKDKLFKKLDKILLRGLSDGQSFSQTCPATPRLARRNITRRQRIGSSPMINTLAEASADSSEGMETKEQEHAWSTFKRFSESLKWQFPFTYSLESSKLDRSSQKLLHYYQRVCPVPDNMWKTACLVTDYVLYLIALEIQNIGNKSGYRFIQFLGTGSARNGTKVSKANQFDVLMVVQPPAMPELVFESSKGSIPPGMVVVSVNTGKHTVGDRHVISNCEVDGLVRSCLSAKECAISAESMVKDSLHSLYTMSRSAMDRLPFQMKGAPTAVLTLNIDTRALVGFGEPEIKVRIIPVLPLPIDGWYQMPLLYATPPLAEYEYKQRSETRGVLNPDLLWQVESSELDTVFSIGVESLMKHARVDSCNVICLKVLKALLTGGIKNNLLDRGVFPSSHLATVINFLLLESAPNQWTFEKLGDRFSDAIHFLKSAYSCNRLPHFFINNPHLISKMPYVAENKVLTQKRQRNLLAGVSSEALEKRLQYLESCLREAGLADCVKEEFSNDMWEFEFFLFN